MLKAWASSRTGHRNIHRDERDRWMVDLRIIRKGEPVIRVSGRFDTLKEAKAFRDRERRKLGLPL